jgi:hypothetical protein
MRLRRSVQEQSNGVQNNMSQEKSTLATKEGRWKIYVCVFCEFVQKNISGIDEDAETGILRDKAFEAKYLYHLRSVHCRER